MIYLRKTSIVQKAASGLSIEDLIKSTPEFFRNIFTEFSDSVT